MASDSEPKKNFFQAPPGPPRTIKLYSILFFSTILSFFELNAFMLDWYNGFINRKLMPASEGDNYL